MKKKVLSSLLAASMVACLFAGCTTTSSSSNSSASGDTQETTAGNSGEAATKPTLEDYGSGEILIWAPDQTVDLTKKAAEDFLAANEAYKGYTVRVEPVGEDQAANNAVTDLEAAADIFSFAQDQLNRLVSAGALAPVTGAYADGVAKNNLERAVGAVTLGEKVYAFPTTADNGYFMYYDTTVVTDPTSLEQILKDCEAAGKSFYFDVGNGWYQPSFFFGVGCELTYDVDSEAKITGCNINYDSDLGVVAMREMIDLVASPAFVAGASVGNAINPGVVISGTWDKEQALAKFVDAEGNSVLGTAKLPEFEGSDGKSHQMGGFSGYKLMGVKKQTEQGKAIVCMELAEYLTSTEVQLARFEALGWGPSNLKARENSDVQNDPVLIALEEQALHTILQGQYPGSYWSEAGNLASEITSKNLTASSTDDEIRAVLKSFQEKCIGFATAE